MRIVFTLLLSFFILSSTAFARMRVVTTYPYIADIVEKIGKGKVSVRALARGNRDPHHIVPRPSLIMKLRRADLFIINGAEIEIGWVPPLLRDSRNANIQPGRSGFVDLSVHVKLIQVPDKVSRAQGDVHPAGNPHFNLNPDYVLTFAQVIMKKLCELDGSHCALYRGNYADFKGLWQSKISQWKEALKPLKGVRVVQYHRSHDYFLLYFGIVSVGELEPLPGIPPTSRHILKIIQRVKNRNVKFILQDVYHSVGPSRFVADRTNARVLVLPHDVRAVSETDDIVSLYDEIVRRLTR